MDWLQILNDVGYPALFIFYLIYRSQKDAERNDNILEKFQNSLNEIVDKLNNEITEVKADVKDIKNRMGGGSE